MKRLKDRHWMAAIVMVCLLAFGNIFQNAFVWDDFDFIVNNPDIRSLWNIPSFFAKAAVHGNYTPLETTLFALTYNVWGKNPFGYHLVALTLHTLCCLLAYLIAKRLFKDARYAAVAALLFAAHPMHTERVTNMTGSFNMLAVLLSLAAFHQYLRIRNDDDRGHATVLALFMLATLSSEAGFSLPLILLAYELAHFGGLGRRAGFFKACVVLALISLAYRTWVLGAIARTKEYATGGFAMSVLAAPGILVGYAVQLLIPIHPTVCHTPIMPESPLSLAFVLPMAALIIAIVCSVINLRRHPDATFAFWFFLVSLIPYMNILPQVTAMADRYLYLPSFGFCLLGAGALRFASRKTGAIAITSAVCLTLLAYVAITRGHNIDWRSERSLWESTIDTNPDCVMAHINLGDYYLGIGDIQTAIGQYDKAAQERGGPKATATQLKALNNLGIAYAKMGDCQSAEKSFTAAISRNPGYLLAKVNLARTYEACGRPNAAVEVYKQMIGRHPDYQPAYLGLAELYRRQNMSQDAEYILKTQPAGQMTAF
jgi:hypothetical protein